ncbi:MAG: Zn-dependent hydrolase [Hyphomicrobiaceae bacterium]
MLEINAERLLADLYELREIGKYKSGVHRPTLSPDDMRARAWMKSKLEAIGHEVEIDGIANVIGRAPGQGPHVLAGSHIESQNHAGWLDGALGVVYAIEAARAVKESGRFGERGVDVVAFADEEGHFLNYIGSYSFCGELDDETIDGARNRTDGSALRARLAEAGLADRPRRRLEQGRYKAFLEAHIEQGDWLESEGLSIGVVTSIVGIWQYRVVFRGVQNHAGTTRMAIRKDAGVALTRLCQRIEAEFPKAAGPRSVWTVGRITLDPGAPSIIPGGAEMLFQFRDAEPEVLTRLEACLMDLVAEANRDGPCTAELQVISRSVPAVMDERVQSALEAAARHFASGAHARMPSGAGHDCQIIARHLPSGMLFVPSIGGISHHWSENTSDEDLMLGGRVFGAAIGQILERPE